MQKFIYRGAWLILLIFLVQTNTAFAVEYGGIGGRPANPQAGNQRSESIFIHTVTPGSHITDAVRVINNTAEKKTLLVSAVDSVVASGGAFSCAQEADVKKDVGAWIVLEKQEVTLESLSNEVVPFTLAIPANASVGEHNGCIVIQEKKVPQKTQQQGIALSFRTGIRVALLVPGEISRKIEIVSLSIAKSPNGEVLLRPQVKNLGNVSVDTDVQVTTRNMFGIGVGSEGGQYPVLRGETSEWNFVFKKPFWGGWFKTTLAASYDASTDASVGVKSGKPLVTIVGPSVWFFSPPTPPAAAVEVAILICLFFIVFSLWLYFKRRRWIKAMWVPYVVQLGDTLPGLAKKFDVSWKLLAQVNSIPAPFTLAPGQKMLVPPSQ